MDRDAHVNESFYRGYIHDFTIIHGVIMIEALAQLRTVVLLGVTEYKDFGAIFGGIDEFRFYQLWSIGDTLLLAMELTGQ
ncbi:MAG: hypothetical protein SU899_02760 [Chloroflexota bacterium]|nr:hypothetical protein [Chloroflexota bacterium]